MSVNIEVYDWVLNNEEFINFVWNKFDATTKIEILEKSGVDWVEEYEVQQLKEIK